MFLFGRGHLYSRYWARLRIGFCQRGSRSKSWMRIRERKSSAGKSATELPFSGPARSVVSRWWSIFSRRRTFRIASRPGSSLSPHRNTGRPVSWARSTNSVKSAKGRLWAPRGAVKAIRPAAAILAASFSPSARADCDGGGRVHWVEIAGVANHHRPRQDSAAWCHFANAAHSTRRYVGR